MPRIRTYLLSQNLIYDAIDVVMGAIASNKMGEDTFFGNDKFPYERFLNYLSHLMEAEVVPSEFLDPVSTTYPISYPSDYMHIYVEEFIKNETYGISANYISYPYCQLGHCRIDTPMQYDVSGLSETVDDAREYDYFVVGRNTHYIDSFDQDSLTDTLMNNGTFNWRTTDNSANEYETGIEIPINGLHGGFK